MLRCSKHRIYDNCRRESRGQRDCKNGPRPAASSRISPARVRRAFSEICLISLSLLDPVSLAEWRIAICPGCTFARTSVFSVVETFAVNIIRINIVETEGSEGPTLLRAATNAGKLHVVCVSDRRYARGRRRARLRIMMLMMPRHDCAEECFKVHAIAIRMPDNKLLFADVIHIVASFGL